MIGLIIWASLIIFIVICINGWSFIGMLLLCWIGYLALYLLICWIKNRWAIPAKEEKSSREIDSVTIACEQNREKAIDEWERKWKRKHPCRK